MKKISLALGALVSGLALARAGCGTGGQENSGAGSERPAFERQISQAGSRPDTLILSNPADPSSSSTARFTFSCNKPKCVFKCKLDGQGFKSCKSPKTYYSLANGAHSFKVKAQNKVSGLWDLSPDIFDWNIALPVIAFTPISMTNAPSPRYSFSAVWTGSEMIVWGGFDGVNLLNTGGRYDPVGDSWTPTATGGAPSARDQHSAVWTGTKMIVWGGAGETVLENPGGIYDPAGNSWAAISTLGAPSARFSHTAVWSGTAMLVWGGFDGLKKFKTGGSYDPGGDSWTAISTVNAPSARYLHSAVWTGTYMIVWGGENAAFGLKDGARYNPSLNSWSAVTPTGVPDRRTRHSAIWTGYKMIVWGGWLGTFTTDSGGVVTP